MSIINIKEVKLKIAFHEEQLETLKRLLKVAGDLDGGTTSVRQGKTKVAPEAGETEKPKKKRGAVTSAIMKMLEKSSKPVSSGEIRSALEKKKIIQKGSTTIYSQLQQMAKRGSIKKTTGKNGIGYTTSGSADTAK